MSARLAVAKQLWTRKFFILCVSLLFGAVGAAYSLFATEMFRAETVLMPISQKSASGALGQLSGLASLVGVNIGATNASESVAILKSNGFTRQFIEDLRLTDTLRTNQFGSSAWDTRDAVQYFDENVRTVTEDKKTEIGRAHV